MRLIKRNKRFYIENQDGDVLYSPPDFLRPYIHNRAALQKLANDFSIQSVIEFENKCRPNKS